MNDISELSQHSVSLRPEDGAEEEDNFDFLDLEFSEHTAHDDFDTSEHPPEEEENVPNHQRRRSSMDRSSRSLSHSVSPSAARLLRRGSRSSLLSLQSGAGDVDTMDRRSRSLSHSASPSAARLLRRRSSLLSLQSGAGDVDGLIKLNEDDEDEDNLKDHPSESSIGAVMDDVELDGDGEDDDNVSRSNSHSSDSHSSFDPDKKAAEVEATIRYAFLGAIVAAVCGRWEQYVAEAVVKTGSAVCRLFNQCFDKLTGHNDADVGTGDLPMDATDLNTNPLDVTNSFSSSGGTSGGAGGAAGGGAAGQAGMVAQMGAMAAQSAASATAAATTAATAAAAAATTAASTIAGAIAGAGVAAQAGMAIGAATIATVAVTSGVAFTQQQPVPTPAPTNYTNNITDTFIPPVCSIDAEKKVGYVQLQIQGMPVDALPLHQYELEILFRDIYNNISGMCLDPFSRVMHSAELWNWTTHYELVPMDPTNETSPTANVPITTTNWMASVACNGW
jgi:hypothetical protein